MYRPTDRLCLFASLHVSSGYIKIKLKYKVFDQHIFFPVITATSEAVRVSHLRFMNFQVIQVSVAMWALSCFLLFGQNIIIIKDSALGPSYFAVTRQQNYIRHSSFLLLQNKNTNFSIYKYSVS